MSAQDRGWTRRRRGGGFSYLDADGRPLPPEEVERVKALAIPPAWKDVWICPHPRGHLQAVGTDDAGRRQYLYHPEWRRQRDEAKHDRALDLARQLPRVRRTIRRRLSDSVPQRTGVLDLAVMLIDLGCFRPGSEDYLQANGSFGLTTLELRHACASGAGFSFSYVGKHGVEQEITIEEPVVVGALRKLTGRRDPHARLLCAREGRGWVPLDGDDLNEHLRGLFTLDVTAKDFRTWHGTVVAATALASVERASSQRARRRQIKAAMEEASDVLGNTPTVARTSYVDPRVIDLFEEGQTIAEELKRLPRQPERRRDALDRAVVKLLEG